MKQGFFISKKEHKRNLKKPHKWRVQAICGEEKSQPPKGISIKMFKKKTGGKRVNCFLYIVHRAPEKMSKKFAKKVSKEGAKGHREKRKGRFWEVLLGERLLGNAGFKPFAVFLKLFLGKVNDNKIISGNNKTDFGNVFGKKKGGLSECLRRITKGNVRR